MTNGYNFYFKDGTDVLTLPITPSKLSIKAGSNNKVVTLINEGDINILKSPSLIEVEFEARFPMHQYPYAREFVTFNTYFDKFTELKEAKRPFRFIVVRTKPNGEPTWDTNLLRALEDLDLTEDADEGDDVLVNFKLKQYKSYGVKRYVNGQVVDANGQPLTSDSESEFAPTSTSTSVVSRPNENSPSVEKTTHVVKEGETLWSISKQYYGTGSNRQLIYDTNKTVIEEDAKKHGKASSSNGQWIREGLELLIPAL